MPWCALLTAVKNYNKSLEKLQDFFFKTETNAIMHCLTADRKQSHVTRLNQSQSDQPISSAQPITPTPFILRAQVDQVSTGMWVDWQEVSLY